MREEVHGEQGKAGWRSRGRANVAALCRFEVLARPVVGLWSSSLPPLVGKDSEIIRIFGGNMQEELLKDISGKMDIIINLLAKLAVSEKNTTEAIVFLNQLGLPNKLVSTLLDTTPNTVAVRLSETKKKRTK
jgi:hypothetical protein